MARKLKQHGFDRIRPLEGGMDAWLAAGLPVEGQAPSESGGLSRSSPDGSMFK